VNSLFEEKEDLFNELEANRKLLEKRHDESIEIPKYIIENINHSLFSWQENALKNFLIYESDYKNTPTHLMFNMATGSGKTLLMASLILYYYKQGYRHFLFFVNQNNIVNKTENNFLDYTHKKYLFNNNIVIDNKRVEIKKVDVFSDNPSNIEIKFATMQKLHNDIRTVKENINTLEEFNNLDIVMLADEGHHFNSITKKKSQSELNLDIEIKDNSSEEDKERAWEYTVINLLLRKEKYKNKQNKNVLLEFTATIPENENVYSKYRDKIVYKFPLINFLQEGYTKEINLVSTQLNKKERILFALLFNWYRHKLALIFRIPNFKPVVLFRSKTIEESKTDYENFINLTENINEKDFDFFNTIKNKINTEITPSYYEDTKTKTEILAYFIRKNKIEIKEIVDYIKYNFKKENIIITNSDDKTKTKEKTDSQTEILLNNLEDKNNHIRAIFTVKRLTEGWDVLNLFDIVRLSEGQNSGGGSNKKTANATVEEAQLIGRGVRYNPFTFSGNYDDKYSFYNEGIKAYPFKYKYHNPYKRKFDNDLTHDLRMLEELNYYTYDEKSRYITDLKNELRKRGLIRDDKIKKEFYIKEEIKQTDFYKNINVFCNELKENPDRIKLNLDDIKERPEIKNYQYKTKDIIILEDEITSDTHKTLNLSNKKAIGTISISIKEYPKNIFYKCIHSKAAKTNSIFSFERLKKELNITSIKDLLKSEFLGDVKIEIITKETQSFDNIGLEDKINALSNLLDKIGFYIENEIIEKVGTDFEKKNMKNIDKIFGAVKEKLIYKNNKSNKNIVEEDWFMLNDYTSTNEEDSLIDFIKNHIGNLKNKYDEVYLLRNEEVYKIYSFKDGRSFQPDFLLFLREKNNSMYFQIFIEAKGEHLIKHDEWKNEFLEEISKKYDSETFTLENKDYRLIALPLYNEGNDKTQFETFNNFKAMFNSMLLNHLKYTDT